MTSEYGPEWKELIDRFSDAYASARNPVGYEIGKSADVRIQRGKSRLVAEELEDIWAGFIAKNFAREGDKLLVNYEFFGSNKSWKRRFDVVWIRDNSVHQVFEVKADMGYARNQVGETLSGYDSDLTGLLASQWVTTKSGNANDKRGPTRSFTVNKNVKINIVIVSTDNSGNSWPKQPYHDTTYPGVTVTFVAGTRHLNARSYEKPNVPNSTITLSFEQLFAGLK